MKFEFNWPKGFRGEDVWKCWRTDRRTDDRVTGILLAHPWAFGSGELKIRVPISEALLYMLDWTTYRTASGQSIMNWFPSFLFFNKCFPKHLQEMPCVQSTLKPHAYPPCCLLIPTIDRYWDKVHVHVYIFQQEGPRSFTWVMAHKICLIAMLFSWAKHSDQFW